MNEGPERLDYQETSDVTEVHAAVKREHSEPSADVTPIPLWLTGLCGAAIAWAGAYFGVFHGGFSSEVYNEYTSSPAVLFPLPKAEGAGGDAAAPVSLAQQGKTIYANCVPCHQASGAGVPGQFPPLVNSEWVHGEKRLVAILLKGIQGALTVEGKTFNGAMPAWEASLTDKKIAAVASYVRAEYGKNLPEISEAKVKAARAEFASKTGAWSEAELNQIPADATLPDAAGAAPAPAPAAAAAPTVAPAATTTAATAPSPAPAPAAAPAPVPADAPAAAPAGSYDLKASVERGKVLYMQTCIACHQPTGLGLPGAFPPLGGSEYVTENPRRMVAILAKGLQGPLTVKGTTYNNIMMALEMQFPVYKEDAKLADVANYVRNSFGNTATEPITPELVADVKKEFASRATPWTEADLKAFPAPAK